MNIYAGLHSYKLHVCAHPVQMEAYFSSFLDNSGAQVLRGNNQALQHLLIEIMTRFRDEMK